MINLARTVALLFSLMPSLGLCSEEATDQIEKVSSLQKSIKSGCYTVLAGALAVSCGLCGIGCCHEDSSQCTVPNCWLYKNVFECSKTGGRKTQGCCTAACEKTIGNCCLPYCCCTETGIYSCYSKLYGDDFIRNYGCYYNICGICGYKDNCACGPLKEWLLQEDQPSCDLYGKSLYQTPKPICCGFLSGKDSQEKYEENAAGACCICQCTGCPIYHK